MQYQKQISAAMDNMIEEKREKILDKYVHNFNYSCNPNSISLSNKSKKEQSQSPSRRAKFGSIQSYATPNNNKKTNEIIPEEKHEDSGELKCDNDSESLCLESIEDDYSSIEKQY